MGERIAAILRYRNEGGVQFLVWIFLLVGAVALAVALGWLAIEFTIRIVETFEVIGEIVSWILWPFRL